eukprot:6948718-Prymnesium_polylepis.1
MRVRMRGWDWGEGADERTCPTAPCVQWAAVRTHVGEMSVPPQKWAPPSVWRETSHGYWRG